MDALDDLANLTDGHSGPGSLGPKPGQITGAWRFLRCLRFLTADVPTGVSLSREGTVVVEWVRPDKRQTCKLETITASLAEVTLIRVGDCADYLRVQS
jgi:hypothetical protein